MGALYQKVKWNMSEKKNYYFLGELFDKIQSDLHERCQLPEMTAFNGTQFIKFKKSKFEIDLEELSVDKDLINCNPLEPVPDTVVKYDELNEDVPELQKVADIQMHQM